MNDSESYNQQTKKLEQVSWYDTSLFFRLGFFRYGKINAYVDEYSYLGLRQEVDKWYKIDLLLDWTSNYTSMYVDGVF